MEFADIVATDHAVRVLDRAGGEAIACGEFGGIDQAVADLHLGLVGADMGGVVWLHDNGDGSIEAAIALASSTPVVQASGGEHVEVAISKSLYLPDPLEIEAGTTVTWINRDALPHTTTATTREAHFDSGYMALDDASLQPRAGWNLPPWMPGICRTSRTRLNREVVFACGVGGRLGRPLTWHSRSAKQMIRVHGGSGACHHHGIVFGRTCSARRQGWRWRSKQHGHHPGHGDREEGRNRSLRRPRREDQLEHRHRIAQLPLELAEWAVPSTDHECCTLHQQERHREPQVAASATHQGAPPHFGQSAEFDDAPQEVCDAEAPRAVGQLPPRGATMRFVGGGWRFGHH